MLADGNKNSKVAGEMDETGFENGSGNFEDAAQLADDLRSMLERADLLGLNLVAIHLENAIGACLDTVS